VEKSKLFSCLIRSERVWAEGWREVDVHKQRSAVVLSAGEADSEFRFEERMFGSDQEQLRSLAACAVERETEEGVMESTAPYRKPAWGALGRYWTRCARSEKAQREGPGRCIWRRRYPIADGEDA